MTTRRTKDATETTVTEAPFQLNIPAELTAKPDWEIELPAKHKALVFKEKILVPGAGTRDTTVFVDGYRLMVVTRHGASANVYYGGEGGHICENKATLEAAIKSAAREVTPKKRRVVRETEDDYED